MISRTNARQLNYLDTLINVVSARKLNKTYRKYNMSLKDQVLDRYIIELDKRASEILKAPLRQL